MSLEDAGRLAYPLCMRSVEDIEAEIQKLPPGEVVRLAEWLAEYQAQAWDKKIADDAKSGGGLRRFVDTAKADFKAGRTRPLP
jgi:hypothetical protein